MRRIALLATLCISTVVPGVQVGNAEGLLIRGGDDTGSNPLLRVENMESTAMLVVEAGGNVGIGTSSPGKKLEVEASGTTVAGFNRMTNNGTVISIQQDGAEEGTISVTGSTVSYNAFTGSHYGWTDRNMDRGTLVTLTGDNRRLHDNADSEIIYGVGPCSIPNDPRILGSYLGLQESQDPAGSGNPYLVMAVGNGEMWVVDDGQDVEIGDHLISSNVDGHAMQDTGEFPVSHVVGIAAEAVHWDDIAEVVDGRKHRRISVLFERFALNHGSQPEQEIGGAGMDQVRQELAELRSSNEDLAQNNEELGEANEELRAQLSALAAAVSRLETMVVDTKSELATR